MEASSLEEFLDDVYQDYPQHKGKWEIEDFLKKYYLNAGGPIDEGKVKDFLKGAALLAALIGLNKAASENIYNKDPKIKELTSKYEKAEKEGDKEAMADFKKEIKKRKLAWDAGRPMDEAKTIELPADTTFTVDLKHLMKKHMDEGKSKEDTIKLTKALMAKLHDKGEVIVNDTKVVFKKNKTNEASVMGIPLESFADYYTALELAKNVGVPVVAFSALLAIMGVKKATEFLKKGKEAVMAWYEQNKLNEQEDAQLALPEPDAPDFLGDDGMDYEGGMAKSQMLKMKKYAMALCDMIDDESQLESWVQAKLTKASDYMSSVYHYLDYQKSKMNEELSDREKAEFSVSKAASGPLPDKYRTFKDAKKEFLTPIIYQDIRDALKQVAFEEHNDSTQSAKDFVEGLPKNYMKLTYDKVDGLIEKAGGYDILDLAKKYDDEVVKKLVPLLVPFYKNTVG